MTRRATCSSEVPLSLAGMDERLVHEHYSQIVEWRAYYESLAKFKDDSKVKEKIEAYLSTCV